MGSVLYAMCSGGPPFRATSTLAVLKHVVEFEPKPLLEVAPDVPDWLAAIITRLLAKNPAERISSAEEVGELLTHGPPSPSASTLERQSGRRKAALAIVALVLLVGLGLTETVGLTNLHGTVIRWLSPTGTLIVKVDDPLIRVTIDGEELVIHEAGVNEIRLKPGRYELRASKEGEIVRQELVTVTRNGRQVVRVMGEAPGFEEIRGPEAKASVPETMGGRWKVEGNEIVQSKPGGIAVLLFGDSEWTDYDVTIETLTTGGQTKSEGGNLLFRATSAHDYLAFALGGYGGTFNEAFYFTDGNWGRNVPPRPTVHETERWYKVRVQVRGSRIQCWQDGREWFDFENTRFPLGRIGLSTWNSNSPVRWRNLRVVAPDGNLLWEGLPELPATEGETETALDQSEANGRPVPTVASETDPGRSRRGAESPHEAVHRLPANTFWLGSRTYRRGAYAGSTVHYELHVRKCDSTSFEGHVFDNGKGRNLAQVEGTIDGSHLTWTEKARGNVLTIHGTLDGDTLRVNFQGLYSNGTRNLGDGELKRMR